MFSEVRPKNSERCVRILRESVQAANDSGRKFPDFDARAGFGTDESELGELSFRENTSLNSEERMRRKLQNL